MRSELPDRGLIGAGRLWVVAAAAGLFAATAGCEQILLNQTAERSGTIGVQFINNTPFRASFSFGTYDALDHTPGPVDMEQLRVEANQTTAAVELPCRRNMAIGTAEFVDRVIETGGDDVGGFDPDAFSVNVNFSSADADSDGAALPTQGTAEGLERLLGVDYGCRDLLIFTFVQDGAAPGGFRIDSQVIVDNRE